MPWASCRPSSAWALYSLFRLGVGPQVANGSALLVSAVANTAANRRLTFGVRGRSGAVRHQAQGLVVFAIGLALTSGSLAALGTASGSPSHGTELAVLITANLAATVLRFLLLRAWVFPARACSNPTRTRLRTRLRGRPMTTATITAAAPPEPDRGAGPRWARPALYGLLLAVGLAYFSNLSASGYANSFYSAAVQAGSQSWKALFFGSLDSANAITVDKPPAALWPMALSVRMFGLNSWAILAPQVLMALATAAVLNSAVRRRFGPVAGLIAVGVFALTPVAALMFRFNNPDALLALLMTVTVWCVLRALEQGRTKWLLWAGAAVGLAFLTKTLQAFLILPPLAVLYAVCAPVPVRKRLGQLALSALTMLVTGGWWVAIVELMPASSRPYVGGSQNNSFLELTFGYNGLGRINGEETGSVGGGGSRGGGGWGETGIGRMFNSEVGGQIAWLLPAALILLVAGLWLTRKAGRTDSARAAFIAWGGALVMTAAVFSFMAGIFHQYYTVALAPYVAALVAMGVVVLWEERSAWWPRAVLAGTVLATVLWAYVLLGRTPDYLPWLRWAVLAGGIVGALGLLVAGRFGGRGLAVAVVGLSCAASLAGADGVHRLHPEQRPPGLDRDGRSLGRVRHGRARGRWGPGRPRWARRR